MGLKVHYKPRQKGQRSNESNLLPLPDEIIWDKELTSLYKSELLKKENQEKIDTLSQEIDDVTNQYYNKCMYKSRNEEKEIEEK